MRLKGGTSTARGENMAGEGEDGASPGALWGQRDFPSCAHRAKFDIICVLRFHLCGRCPTGFVRLCGLVRGRRERGVLQLPPQCQEIQT